MFSKTMLRSVVSVLGIVLALSLCIGFSGSIAMAQDDDWDECGNNDEFTSEFRLGDCKFQDKGVNPFFILKPGYRLVLESDEEKSVETVLRDTKTIHLNGRKIKTRVYEERAIEDDVLIEISRNWLAICKKTNAVYYFGEWSRDCPDGFDENDVCTGDESNDGSWEAGVDGAMPGLIMPGTILLGSKYFQEMAPPDAVDRGQIEEMGLDWPEDDPEFTGCIKIVDTNPAEGDCDIEGEDADIKIYCPDVGLVQDQDLELVEYGFVDRDGDDDDDNDDDDDDDDDDHDKRKRWRKKWHRR